MTPPREPKNTVEVPFVTSGGGIGLGQKRLVFPNTKIRKQIGKGVNGYVFLGEQEFLGREVAVKIWLKLKVKDRRNKFAQGILEARKAVEADSSSFVARVYDAGEINDIFYATMEYASGVTLTDWLKSPDVKFIHRCYAAVSIVWESCKLAQDGLLHGDLHTDNVMIECPITSGASELIVGAMSKEPSYKIIDFGTSHFSGPVFSEKRHWRVKEETVDRLVHPFRVEKFSPASNCPHMSSVAGKVMRYMDFFEKLPAYLAALGCRWLDYDYAFEAPGRAEDRLSLPEQIRNAIEEIRSSDTLEVTAINVGNMNDWGKLIEGRLHADLYRTFPDMNRTFPSMPNG